MLADLDALAQTAPGRYVLAHMPPSAQAVRLAGDPLMGLGARRRNLALLLTRSYVVQVAWILARTWANDGQGGLVFWLHATLRRGAEAVRS